MPDEVDDIKCPLCGERTPIYCEKCFKDEVEAQLKIHGYSRIEDIMKNPYSDPYTPKFPKIATTDIKAPKIEIPHIEISTFPKDPIPFPEWVATYKPDAIKCGADLADGPDQTVEELTQWKKEDKPESNLEKLMQELDEDTIKSVREYVKEYAKQQQERVEECDENGESI